MRVSILLFILLFVMFIGPALAVVNINTATQTELEALQGIGPAKAKAIIEHRQKHGMFTSAESLIDVAGIGSGTMNQLRDRIIVENTPAIETTAAMVAQ